MPFLFIWTIVLAIPLIMSTGIIGLEQYLTYFLPNLSYWPMHLIGVGATAAIVILLYRKIESIKAITIGLWIVMLVAVRHDDRRLVHQLPPPAWRSITRTARSGRAFVAGARRRAAHRHLRLPRVQHGRVHGRRAAQPGQGDAAVRSSSRSSRIMAFYLAMSIGVLGVLPWQKVAHASSVASLAVTQNWGRPAADAVTALILVTAMASVFAGLLGGSRVPYHAARDGLFFRCVRPTAPQARLPQVSLLVMGLITAAGSFITLTTIITCCWRSSSGCKRSRRSSR